MCTARAAGTEVMEAALRAPGSAKIPSQAARACVSPVLHGGQAKESELRTSCPWIFLSLSFLQPPCICITCILLLLGTSHLVLVIPRIHILLQCTIRYPLRKPNPQKKWEEWSWRAHHLLQFILNLEHMCKASTYLLQDYLKSLQYCRGYRPMLS